MTPAGVTTMETTRYSHQSPSTEHLMQRSHHQGPKMTPSMQRSHHNHMAEIKGSSPTTIFLLITIILFICINMWSSHIFYSSFSHSHLVRTHHPLPISFLRSTLVLTLYTFVYQIHTKYIHFTPFYSIRVFILTLILLSSSIEVVSPVWFTYTFYYFLSLSCCYFDCLSNLSFEGLLYRITWP